MDFIFTDICRKGKSFFWCVTEGYGDYPIAFGNCETLEEAQDLMWGCSKVLRMGREIVDFSENGEGWFAKSAKQAVWIHENAKPTGEFVYERNYEDDGDNRYEIVKKTEKRIYVLNGHGKSVWQLDRIALEELGMVWHGDRLFHAEPYEVRCAGQDTDGKLLQLEVEAEYQRMRQAVSDEEVETLRKKLPDCPEDILVKFAFAKKELGTLAK